MAPAGRVAGRRQRVAIWGAGGHAKVVADVLAAAGETDVAGAIVDGPAPAGAGFAVLGDGDALPRLRDAGTVDAVLVAVGDCAARDAIASRLASMGVALAPPAVHPRATVSRSATLADGVVVVAGAVIGPDAHVGRCAIVNTGATVDHDCIVGQAAHVGPGAHVGGGVVIGARAWIGIGASVKHGVAIGEDAIVGAGAAVVRDVEARTVVVGVPARPLRPRSAE